MQIACKYAKGMHRLIQIRNVPDKLHRRLKARAAMAGMSLSEYLLAELSAFAERPTHDELVERLARRSPVRTRISPARAVRAERERR